MDLNKIISSRRSVYPPMYNDDTLHLDEINQVLESARWAPNHKKTEPWRYVVIHSESALQDLAEYATSYYKKNTPVENFNAKKYSKISEKIQKSGAVIAICMQRDPEARVPEWEEIAAVSMSVQNMWLTCTEMGLGCYWSSPKYALEAHDYLRLDQGCRCLGFLYVGHWDKLDLFSERKPIESFTTYL